MDPAPASGRGQGWAGRTTLGVIGLLMLFVAAVRAYTHVVQEHYSYDIEAPRVDLNRADLEELVELPGIGEELARRIVSEREVSGPFRDGEELVARVEGIGAHRLALLLEYADVRSVEADGP